MKQILLTIIELLLYFALSAQEPGKNNLLRNDSLRILYPEISGREFYQPAVKPEISYRLDFSAKTSSFNLPKFIQPDWNQYKPKWTIESGNITSLFPKTLFYSPYGFTGMILNQASYRISPKILIGGNSFGFNNILSAPVQKSLNDQWQGRGASMFFEYRFSKNFRIGTQISVSGNQFQP
jgi:hypothetical protein